MTSIFSSWPARFGLFLFFSVLSLDAAEPAKASGELTISEISERTLRLQFAPLDEGGSLRPPSPSTVLVPFASVEKLRTRELETAKEVRVGELRVTIRPQPFVVTVRDGDGKLVQELAFEDGTNRTITFRTEGPVLGLGEGAQQFDRRGALYPMEPSWGG